MAETPAPLPIETWLRYRSAGYMQGSGLAHGLDAPIYPQPGYIRNYQGVTPPGGCLYADVPQGPPRPWTNLWKLDPLSPRRMDFVYVGPRITQVDNPEGFMVDSIRMLREDGHLLVWVPYSEKWNISSVIDLIGGLGRWRVKEALEREGHCLVVAKSLKGRRGVEYSKPPEKDRVCIVRYGAIGDMVMVTPLIRALAGQGFDVTVNAQTFGGAVEVVKNNPFVTNTIIHERNIIPMHELDGYWKTWAAEYTRYINLSESIEGSLLKVEGRRDYFTPSALREALCGDTNYYIRTMEKGGVTVAEPPQGELYFSPAEVGWAKKFLAPFKGRFVLAWGLNGSSFHKMYAPLQATLTAWLEKHPDATAILMGSDSARFMQWQHPQVVGTAGDLKLRESLSILPYVSAYAGPESGLLNSAACFDTPKIALLSHSTPLNLTQGWKNTITLEPDKALAPCYPCHQMHYTRESCPIVQIVPDPLPKGQAALLAAGPACAMGAIQPERIWAALDAHYASWASRSML